LDLVEDVVRQLDEAHFLEGAAFETHRAEVVAGFRAAPQRLAAHAGGAYESDPAALGAQIDAMHASAKSAANGARIVGLVAPHIDPRRGARAYGHAYRPLRERCDAEVFVVFGTAHAPMDRPWALTDKPYATPLGAVPTDAALVDAIERRYGRDARRDEIVHLGEHSIEFQAVFLRHAFPDRAITLVPILCGRLSPGDADTEELLDAVVEALRADGRRACIVAGADLAHVGPRFGDPVPYDAALQGALEARDREGLALATKADAAAFHAHATEDAETRRVCGTSPIYATLRLVPGASGEISCYEQNVDPDDGSIVSYASVVLTDRPGT
jgi:hypothetical protein